VVEQRKVWLCDSFEGLPLASTDQVYTVQKSKAIYSTEQ
jgi:hypothetical protein